ncbi:hypothetical protein GQ55_9G082300 [Panicum hallii var. hallii]|uniref:Potassium channel domain-containing protein n=1 Tax=Panicum hallii var. hallii TaxID=1504633 RepID=A0A2T7C0W8_9POAL|nr:hypothetical protein GQ55_9G082300 [Panicum hallii var. hallii]
MADNSIPQVSIEDPPNVLKRIPSERAKQVRRCRSTPLDPTDQNPKDQNPEDQNPEQPAEHSSVLQIRELPRLRLVGLILFVYLLVGVITFYLVMDQISGKTTNRVLDAFDTTKLFACAFIFIGMAMIALFISKAADYFVEKQKVLFYKALHMNMKGGEAKMLRAMQTSRMKYKFYTVEKLSLVDSFFCIGAMITALGYGAKSFSSKLGRVFAIFWIITSTIILAQFFMYLAELYTERRQKMLARWVLNRRITTMDLEDADLDGDRQVKLKELGKISQEEIYYFLKEFEKLDVDQSGTLSTHDLTLAQASQ